MTVRLITSRCWEYEPAPFPQRKLSSREGKKSDPTAAEIEPKWNPVIQLPHLCGLSDLFREK